MEEPGTDLTPQTNIVSVPFRVSGPRVNWYSHVTGDPNPLHLNPTTPVAQAFLLELLLNQLVTKMHKDALRGRLCERIESTFNNPVIADTDYAVHIGFDGSNYTARIESPGILHVQSEFLYAPNLCQDDVKLQSDMTTCIKPNVVYPSSWVAVGLASKAIAEQVTKEIPAGKTAVFTRHRIHFYRDATQNLNGQSIALSRIVKKKGTNGYTCTVVASTETGVIYNLNASLLKIPLVKT